MTCKVMISNAGPAVNAEAINRGASKEVCQTGRDIFEENKKSVMVWMEMAHNMASTTKAK